MRPINPPKYVRIAAVVLLFALLGTAQASETDECKFARDMYRSAQDLASRLPEGSLESTRMLAQAEADVRRDCGDAASLDGSSLSGPSKSTSKKTVSVNDLDRGNFVPLSAASRGSAGPMAKNLETRFTNLAHGLAVSLNQGFALPYDVGLGFPWCSEENAYWSSSKREIVVCMEYVIAAIDRLSRSGRTDEEIGKSLSGITLFVLFHEIGHALIDVWNLPATGMEEDAVDQLAAFLLLRMGNQGHEFLVASAMDWGSQKHGFLDLMLVRGQLMADEHSLNEQRYYHLLCWMYGADQEKFSSIATGGLLPKTRLGKCGREYQRMDRSWEQLLTPYAVLPPRSKERLP